MVSFSLKLKIVNLLTPASARVRMSSNRRHLSRKENRLLDITTRKNSMPVPVVFQRSEIRVWDTLCSPAMYSRPSTAWISVTSVTAASHSQLYLMRISAILILVQAVIFMSRSSGKNSCHEAVTLRAEWPAPVTTGIRIQRGMFSVWMGYIHHRVSSQAV